MAQNQYCRKKMYLFFCSRLLFLKFQGQANMEIRNNRQQTPLLLAVSQGHMSIIELLVSKGADVHVEDEDGDTCLHLALMRQTVSMDSEESPMLESVSAVLIVRLTLFK